MKWQNHSSVKGAVFNPAFARNVCRRQYQLCERAHRIWSCRAGTRFGLTLAAHRDLGKCLACAFQDGWLFCHRFVAA